MNHACIHCQSMQFICLRVYDRYNHSQFNGDGTFDYGLKFTEDMHEVYDILLLAPATAIPPRADYGKKNKGTRQAARLVAANKKELASFVKKKVIEDYSVYPTKVIKPHVAT